MAGGKKKFYVVWSGVNPGVYGSWDECRLQVAGCKGAKYKSFATHDEALEAFGAGYADYKQWQTTDVPTIRSGVAYIADSLAVDAACSGNPGDMEYRGVHVATGSEWFRVGPLKEGTNNVGEFLALVHGLAYMKRENICLPIYSDSRNAIKWVQLKKCRTKLERKAVNAKVFELIARAEKWLAENDSPAPIIKWDTAAWGEIPADFGRK
ncbi:MAG: ribonuclease H family protein [Tannerella sp.]|nr:ribonuclease H family protein [Tannerella sp.]